MIKLQRIIVTSSPIAFIIRKSKEITIPGFQGIPVYDVVSFFFKQINKVGLNERAAAISFNFIMAIPASILFIFTIVPYLPIGKSFNSQILKIVRDITPDPKTYALIEDFLADFFYTPRGGLLSFGILLVVFYASNAMMGIIRTFDKSIIQGKGYFLQKRIRAIKLTLMLILLVIAFVFLLIGQEALVKWIFGIKKTIRLSWWQYVRWASILGLIFIGISLIYKYAPSVQKRWKLVSPGSLLATFLTLLATIILSYWVNNFGSDSFNRLYSSIGTLLIVMLLIFYNSLILLIGFELNVSIALLKDEVAARKAREKEISG